MIGAAPESWHSRAMRVVVEGVGARCGCVVWLLWFPLCILWFFVFALLYTYWLSPAVVLHFRGILSSRHGWGNLKPG